MTTAAASCVNSVNTSSSDVLVSAVGLFPRRQTGLPTVQFSRSVSQVQNRAPSLYLPLLPPHKVSPIRVDRLRKEASAHPDPQFVDYVLTGIQEGFRVGFNPLSVSLRSARQNMPSASLQPSVIDDYLQTELAKGRVAGPFLCSSITQSSHQPIWCHSQKTSAFQVAFDPGPFLSRGSQRE